MSARERVKEAERVMVICNACRYCEGYCAVFPAMERRRTFSEQDLKYLANLCHNCRDCYYACQYAPPHEFDLNFPKAMGELRLETYRAFSWPEALAGLFRRNGTALSLITAISVVVVVLIVWILSGPSVVFSIHNGEDAFYRVVPYLWIVWPFSLLGLFAVASLLKGGFRFWRETGARTGELLDPDAHGRAARDALRLKYLDGGGVGCNYPDDRFSRVRKWYHHLVFYGFLLCLAATTIAAVYHHFLDRAAPYPFWSWPVVLGTLGGVSLLIGTCGLLYLKKRMDDAPAVPDALGMDVGFIVLLFLTSLTGLLLLLFRETSAMGILLAIHIGIVLGLFITLPYGKFVHGIYRYAALVRNAVEQSQEETAQKKEAS
jgi:citrate/tricarballylate utilization protein